MTYNAPLRDMRFVLDELIGLDRVTALPGLESIEPELVYAVLDEAAKFAREELAPLNQPGDKQGARWQDGHVTTPDGFAEAYARYVAGGWNALSCEPEYGGQGMPVIVSAAVEEMWHASNMAFGLCPLLTRGAIEAIQLCGTPSQKERYLHKLIAGTWTGTMNLTEPQAGSDLSAVRSRAEPDGDRFRIFGQKIYITYGDHDMAENIVHLVLARLPDAPEGVRGISLFVVPKILVNEDGSLASRNDVRCVSIEHKLGIHGSPTAVLAYGDDSGAVGEMVGEPNRGLEYMFVMMNVARFQVGLEGLAISERAWQQALAYARDRVQGTEAGVRGGGKVSIIRHPDVRRMLMSMKAQTEAMRALVYVTAFALDTAARHPDEMVRARAQARADLLTPIVKGWCTETSIEIASTGVQVHGGMGYSEETGAAQHLRDARITTIYEGTTGIQANDLVGRKIARDGGAAAHAILVEMRADAAYLPDDGELGAIRASLEAGIDLLVACVDWVAETNGRDPRATGAGAVPLLKLFGIVAGGWQTARAALVAQDRLGTNIDRDFYLAKIGTARFYADHILAQAHGLAHAVIYGASSVLALDGLRPVE